MKFEYRVLNISDVPKGSNIVNALNDLGLEGWELVLRLNQSSFLLKRVKQA